VAVSGGKWQSVTFQKNYFVSKKRLSAQDSQNKYHKTRRGRMNEHFGFQILHLKGDYFPEDFAPASCYPSTTENKIPSQSARRIPQTLNTSHPNFPTREREPLGAIFIIKLSKGR
jgi:hypothetical protein